MQLYNISLPQILNFNFIICQCEEMKVSFFYKHFVLQMGIARAISFSRTLSKFLHLLFKQK